MVGEPDWPFGATHCRFTLRREGRQILERAFSIQDDGAVARADNFDVRWRADGVACRSPSPGASRGIGSTSWDLTEAQRKAKGPAGDPAGPFVVQESKNPIAWRTKRSDSTGADDRI